MGQVAYKPLISDCLCSCSLSHWPGSKSQCKAPESSLQCLTHLPACSPPPLTFTPPPSPLLQAHVTPGQLLHIQEPGAVGVCARLAGQAAAAAAVSCSLLHPPPAGLHCFGMTLQC